MTRTELINYIIKRMGFKSYLEIGIGTGRNFKAIDVGFKVGVDPDISVKDAYHVTSDEYFAEQFQLEGMFDIVFIDGLHHADQVRKDIINSWECLNRGGCLIIHDTNPHSEHITHVPRDNKEWCGDVYKAVFQIGNPKFTLKDDHGVTVVRKMGELVMSDGKVEWEGFDLFRETILNLKTWDECKEIIDSWKLFKEWGLT